MTVYVRLVSRNDVVTDARGDLCVGGLPVEARCYAPLAAGESGLNCAYNSRIRGRASFARPVVGYDAINNRFKVLDMPDSKTLTVKFSELDGDSWSTNSFNFAYSGIAHDAAPTVRERVDHMM